jgi:hypothetical protein
MDVRSDATQNPNDKIAVGAGLLAVGADLGHDISEMESVRALTLKDGYDYSNNQMVA